VRGTSPLPPGGSPEFLKARFLQLSPNRKIDKNPLHDKNIKKALLFKKNDEYREQYPYVVLICRKKDGKLVPADARIVKTYEALEKITGSEKWTLVHPQPVCIPKDFWKKWKKARSGQERLELVKEHGLIKDTNIFAITCLVADVDSPYEEVEPVFLELVERLGIKGYECGKTKSGNFRAVIYLEPLRVEVKEKKGKRENKKIKTFYLRPNTRAKNGHTHLENAKEIMAIINAYFRKKGLKADDSFKRLNHPVWLGKDFYKRERKKTGETKLYDLYRAVKKLQAEEGLWETNKEFWKEKYKQEKKGKVVIPSFVAKREVKILDDLEKWKIAVRSLAEKYTSYRFTKVMMPAVGWAKDLGLPESEVYDYLRELLPDKRNFDEDFEKAYCYADCTFEWKGKGKDEDLSTEDLVRKFLKKAKGGTLRQTLLKEVFKGKNYLLQKVEKFLTENGYVYVRKEKIKRGRGRKAYIYYLTEKGKAFLKALEEGQSIKQARKQAQVLEKAVGEDGIRKPLSINELKKSIYITPPCWGEQDERKRSCFLSDGLGEDGYKLAKREGLVSPSQGRVSERFWSCYERISSLTPADTPPDGEGRPPAPPAETPDPAPDPDKDKTLDHDTDPDPDELEREILLKLGLSADEVEEYLRLSDEGRLEFLEERDLLEAFQDALGKATAGGEDGEEKKIPPDLPDLPEDGDEDEDFSYLDSDDDGGGDGDEDDDIDLFEDLDLGNTGGNKDLLEDVEKIFDEIDLDEDEEEEDEIEF